MALREYIEGQRPMIEEALNNNKNVEITFNKGVKLAGFLKAFREAFPNNYVDKYGYTYTIYAGDKEFQKMLNKPLDLMTPRKEKQMMRDYLGIINPNFRRKKK